MKTLQTQEVPKSWSLRQGSGEVFLYAASVLALFLSSGVGCS